MLPTNNKDKGCSPVSSNCVVWQGPDIECINLCKGDSVTDVVHKLATELCDLLAKLGVDSYDISCFNLQNCEPKDFKELIQILIDKICELEGLDQSTATGEMGCPSCEVPICEEFYYQTPQGDTATTMELKDYVLAIGNTVCTVLGQIDTINEALQNVGQNNQSSSDNLTIVEFQSLITDCILPGTGGTVEEVLQELEKQFCEQKTGLGPIEDMLFAINAACAGLANENKLNGTGKMSEINGWFSNPVNVSQSMSNLWKTVCDMRSAVKFLQTNIDLSCNAIDVDVEAIMVTNTLMKLNFSGVVPNNYTDTIGGSSIKVYNEGGLPQSFNNVKIKQDYLNNSTTYDITFNTNVNGADNVKVEVDFKVEDLVQGNSCNKLLTTTSLGTDSCPAVTVTESYYNIDYSFPWVGATNFIGVELYDQTGSTLLQSTTIQTQTTTTGQLTGLGDNTSYKLRLVIGGIPCDFVDFTTLEYPCTAPTITSVNPNNLSPTGDQDASTIAAWVAEYESYFGPITP